MTTFEIFNNTSGESVGVYEANSTDEALTKMLHGEWPIHFDTWQEYVLYDHQDADGYERAHAIATWRSDYQVVEVA